MLYALLAAMLFGAATPASKALLSDLNSFQLAGLLYLGAAVGVAPVAFRTGRVRLPSDKRNRLFLVGAIVSGGIVGPVLLLFGLRLAAATSVSLWLNFELAATAVLGVFFFRDRLGPQGWAGVACAFGGAVLLSAQGGSAGLAAAGLVLLACAFWGLDNHLTGLIDGITPAESTFWKGVVAGSVNLGIGVVLVSRIPALQVVGAALVVGAFAYGVSIVLYITSAHALGSTRAQVVFSTAPFFGLLLSALLLKEHLTVLHLGSGLLFAAGIALLFRERHAHEHAHEAVDHEHEHAHDEGHHHHDHGDVPLMGRHSHRHLHDAERHDHTHLPDLHHRHGHDHQG